MVLLLFLAFETVKFQHHPAWLKEWVNGRFMHIQHVWLNISLTKGGVPISRRLSCCRFNLLYSYLVQQGYLHPARIGDGQKKLEPFREICHGHQRALSPWNKRERERFISVVWFTLCITTNKASEKHISKCNISNLNVDDSRVHIACKCTATSAALLVSGREQGPTTFKSSPDISTVFVCNNHCWSYNTTVNKCSVPLCVQPFLQVLYVRERADRWSSVLRVDSLRHEQQRPVHQSVHWKSHRTWLKHTYRTCPSLTNTSPDGSAQVTIS